MRNILVVCELNFARSITAEYVLKRKAKEKNLEINVESAGLFTKEINRNLFEKLVYYSRHFFPRKEMTRKKADNADIILVMNDYMVKRITKDYNQPEEKIICLNIPKDYGCPYTPSLIKLIEDRLKELPPVLFQSYS